jgi:aspartyl-tRNA(Asn)/glutamyl-tRNA(Gln) amidotransferase subunit C
MEITGDVVRKVSEVARLNLTDEEVEKFTPQLAEILDAFSKISEVDTSSTQMSIQPVPLSNVLRDDEPSSCLSVDDALSNAKHKKDSYFKGPKVI